MGPQQLGRVAAAESISVMPMIMAYNGFIPATRIFDPVQPEHAVVLAAGQLLPEVVASGHANAIKVPSWRHGHQGPHLRGRHHARRGSTGLMPCRYIIPFVQRGGKR